MTAFGTEKIGGVKYDVNVNSDGVFWATVDGSDVKAPSLKELRDKLTAITRQKRKGVKIPFIVWESEWHDQPGRIEKGVCTGIHSGNHNLLALMGTSTLVKQISGYHGGPFFQPEQAAQLEKLQRNVEAAAEALEEFTEKYRIDLAKLVEKALAEGDK